MRKPYQTCGRLLALALLISGLGAASAAPSQNNSEVVEKQLAALRAEIIVCYSEHKLEEAAKIFRQMISLMENAKFDNSTIAGTYQSYADLLRTLKNHIEADAAQVKSDEYSKRAGNPIPYSVKGFRLGMSLDSFRSLPPLAEKNESSRLICSCDKKQSHLQMTEVEHVAKIIRCNYFMGDSFGSPSLSIADEKWEPQSFGFIEDHGTYKLYLMQFDVQLIASDFLHLEAAFTKRFGTPVSSKVGQICLDDGTMIPSKTVAYKNGVSGAMLKEHGSYSGIHTTALFALTSLFAESEKRRSAAKQLEREHASTRGALDF